MAKATTTRKRKSTARKPVQAPKVEKAETPVAQEPKEERAPVQKDVILNYKGHKKVVGNKVEYFGNIKTIPITQHKMRIAVERGVNTSRIRNSLIVLTPGNNFVDAGLWALLREEVARDIDSGAIVEVNVENVEMKKVKIDPTAKTAKQKVVESMEIVDLSDMTIRQAQEIVNDTNNLKMLIEIEEGEKETRDSVLKVVRQRIVELKHKAKTGRDLKDED